MLILLKIVLIAIVFALFSHLILAVFSLFIVELTKLKDWISERRNSKNYKRNDKKLVKLKH